MFLANDAFLELANVVAQSHVEVIHLPIAAMLCLEHVGAMEMMNVSSPISVSVKEDVQVLCSAYLYVGYERILIINWQYYNYIFPTRLILY